MIITMLMRVKNGEKRLEIQVFYKIFLWFINLLKPKALIFLSNRFKTLLSFCPTYAKTFLRLIKHNFSLDFYEDYKGLQVFV